MEGIVVIMNPKAVDFDRVLQWERNTLEFLLQHFCDITADKEYQIADWCLQPLPLEMLKYAREARAAFCCWIFRR